ncbi:CHRD domain-containing protein [Verrucomicrobiales bacterium]|nr:CHRD domain-containing protein [Verrucomicrobiales bacterium]
MGPLANTESPLDSVFAEMASGSTYINVRTAANPAGELRGQVHPAFFR